ncbi:MAG: ATPase [Gammaproteobacteria bacterium]|nr:ATPase [Gammaproteobacteria bacterium]
MSKFEDKQLYLGVDGGGSKCRAIIYEPNQGKLAEAVSGPANVLRGADNAIDNIIRATDEALASLSLSADHKKELIAGIGLAGLNLESCMKEMQLWQHPFKQAYFTSDLHIACIGAHSGKDGAVMIVGTGSSALASSNNQIKEIGGHGFPVGDCGSGAWLGLKAIEVTLETLDGLKESSPLTQAITKLYQIDSAIDLAQTVSYFLPVDFAKLAPLVMEHFAQGDQYAKQFVSVGAEYLSKVAAQLIENPNGTATEELPLALIGGLSPLMAQYFSEDVKDKIKQADNPPEIGAVLFAQLQSKN